MRSGRLLAEDSPANLLKVNQCLTLEDVFLKLCMRDKSTNNAIIPVHPVDTTTTTPTDMTLNIVSVYNERNKQYVDGAVVPDDQGVVGLTFHQSKEQLVADEKTNHNPLAIKNENSTITRLDQVAEDCTECCAKPCVFDPVTSYNQLRALVIKNIICMWRNIG